MSAVVQETESVCPECLRRIPAAKVADGSDVYLEKTCPQHGAFRTIIWRGQPEFSSWAKPKLPSFPKNPITEVKDGCPYDCGLCADHRQESCCVLLEITQRCDLLCPVCFAGAGGSAAEDWPLEQISAWYERLMTLGGPYNIQLSGGEPCLRDDLPDIIRMGREKGFTFFQLNTNGLRIARDPAFLAELKQAGLTTVFLQFDGTTDAIYQQIRGRALLAQKLRAIENCLKAEVGVVLVPTLVPGVNTGDIGNIIRLALSHMPVCRGVHFQPISYFGRYPADPGDSSRITIPEIIREIETQTDGLIKAEAFCPPGGENALCSFHANFVVMHDHSLKAITRFSNTSCCCAPTPAADGAAKSRMFVAENWAKPDAVQERPGMKLRPRDDLDIFLERKLTHTFCLSGMAFQDAWTLDLERLKDCYIHVASPDGRLVPFCAYNLTNRHGRSIYRDNPAVQREHHTA